MNSCGGDCVCATQAQTPVIDANKTCPCGKPQSECCHNDISNKFPNDAIGELCESHEGKSIC